MHIDIASVKNLSGSQLKFELKDDIESKDIHLNGLKFKKPVLLSGTISNVNNSFLLKANIKTELELNCSCCNKPVFRQLDLDIEEIFAEHDYSGDGEVWTFSGDTIELNPVIMSNICLNIPMKILCKQDCKGLCPKCGHDLNESDCGCDLTERDPRFDKLNLLVFDNDEEV